MSLSTLYDGVVGCFNRSLFGGEKKGAGAKSLLNEGIVTTRFVVHTTHTTPTTLRRLQHSAQAHWSPGSSI